MDILIFSGQSNMQGSTGEKCLLPPIENCFEYKYLNDSLVPLVSPVGEDIGEKVLCASALGNGSLVPYFCAEYTKSGRSAVAVHVAKGDTKISEWQKGTLRFDAAMKKIQSAIKKTKQSYSVEKIFFIWLQGESDAINFTGTEEYLQSLLKFKNDLKYEIPIDRFAIIMQGYFAAYASWVKGSFEEKLASDESIMRAFDIAEKKDKDFIVLTRICKTLSVNKHYLNPKEYGPHYNNKGMEIIGSAAAAALLAQIQ